MLPRTIRVGGVPLRIGTDVLPVYPGTAGRAIPVGRTTRSLNGVQVVYGGQLGGQLVSPEAAAGKLVVFTVRPSGNGQREYRFYLTSEMTRYADAAGVAGVTLDAVSPARLERAMATLTHPRS